MERRGGSWRGERVGSGTMERREGGIRDHGEERGWDQGPLRGGGGSGTMERRGGGGGIMERREGGIRGHGEERGWDQGLGGEGIKEGRGEGGIRGEGKVGSGVRRRWDQG